MGTLSQSEPLVHFLISHQMISGMNDLQRPHSGSRWAILQVSWHFHSQDCFSDPGSYVPVSTCLPLTVSSKFCIFCFHSQSWEEKEISHQVQKKYHKMIVLWIVAIDKHLSFLSTLHKNIIDLTSFNDCENHNPIECIPLISASHT